MKLKELLNHIIDGSDFLAENDKMYAAAMLASMSVEILGRVKLDDENFLTKDDDSATLFRRAIKEIDGLMDYRKLIFESKNYTNDKDETIKNIAKELADKKRELRLKKAAFEEQKKEVSNVEKRLYDALKQQGREGKKFDLYYALRCGFAHNCLPGERLGLTDKLNNHPYGIEKESSNYVLGVKNFIDNLKKAKAKLDSLEETKMNTEVLQIHQANVWWFDLGSNSYNDLEENVSYSACPPKKSF